MKIYNLCSFTLLLFLCSCATEPSKRAQLEKSYLESTQRNKQLPDSNDDIVINERINDKQFRFVTPNKLASSQAIKAEDVLKQFSDKKMITIKADGLPFKDYLHQVLGQELKVSYLLGDDVKTVGKPVTLNLKEAITEKKLFTLTEELLSQRGFAIRYDDNIFYIHKAEGDQSKGNVVYGYGKNINDVPQTSFDVIQMVQFEYGMQATLGNTLRQMLGVKTTVDTTRNTITIQAKRKDVIRALELIQIMDQPSMRDRQIGLFKTTFVPTDQLVNKLTELLKQEGISIGTAKSISTAISIVEVPQQGEVFFFANNTQVIERAVFWAEKIDKPVLTAEKQYFIYSPEYSRSVDMGESLQALIGGSQGLSKGTSAAQQNKKGSTAGRGLSVANSKNMRMVVDERANVLIFHTSGEEYQQILPLIKRLDVLPKQVMLEVMIAEVTLADEFKQGVEFALNDGSYGLTTEKAFFGDGFGGLAYAISGSNISVGMELFQSNSLVNVLSKPSIVVRDGVNANIKVGTDIPIVGETASDPLNPGGSKQTTKIEYRKTGVDLSVTPTVNAQGVVLMEITQSVSNTPELGSTSALNPSIFERSIKTEVVAQSGQTIMLGGLISENRSNKETKVPLLGSLPLIGALFRGNTDSGDKTELVIFVTPRVIESAKEWQDIKAKFGAGLSQLNINE
ncbi:secretin N-terminal domain-containing protein [Colwelliaceae bacterium 6441]